MNQYFTVDLMASGRSPSNSDLCARLSRQLHLIENLEHELSDLQRSKQSNWRNVTREYLLQIRDQIVNLRERETELKDQRDCLKQKVHSLKQEVSDLTVKRLKLSNRKPSSIGTSAPSTSRPLSYTHSPTSIRPGMFTKRPAPPSNMVNEAFQPTPSVLTHDQWRFESLKSPMANLKELDLISQELGIKTLPEMVFSKSYLKLTFSNSLEIKFDAINGLKPCLGAPPKEKQVEVQYASEWKRKSNRTDVERLQFEYDWTYTTDYKGDYRALAAENDDEKRGNEGGLRIDRDVSDRFNMVLLKDRTAPILYSCHCILYEDELSDNGMSQLSARIRVMPKCFLVLLRYWLRVDNVLIRVRDTRLYHEFGHDHVLQHYQEREAKWEDLLRQHPMTQLMQFTDPNVFADKIDIVHSTYNKIYV